MKNKDAGWTLNFYVRNLTNAYYWSNTAKILDTVVRYAGAPRTFGATFSVRWGGAK